jgi:hypothetical protein
MLDSTLLLYNLVCIIHCSKQLEIYVEVEIILIQLAEL